IDLFLPIFLELLTRKWSAPEKRKVLQKAKFYGFFLRQFGNLLVLQAAYRHPKLRSFVDKDVLKNLLEKTLHFLHTLSPISPSLAQDVLILKDAASKLDFLINT